jgi:Zinc knuckle/Retroviral aspartyl protease
MDLDAARQGERERRRILALCFYCGESNHIARDCPRKKAQGPPATLCHRPYGARTKKITPLDQSRRWGGTEEELCQWEDQHDELLLWERKANQHHLATLCTFENIASEAMVDSGATGYSFVNESFAHEHQMKLIPLSHSRVVQMFDGSPPSSGMITHVVRGQLSIGQHTETTFFVTKLSGYEVILGIPWLRRHNLTIDWPLNRLNFSSSHCRSHCLRHRLPLSIQGRIPEQRHEVPEPQSTILQSTVPQPQSTVPQPQSTATVYSSTATVPQPQPRSIVPHPQPFQSMPATSVKIPIRSPSQPPIQLNREPIQISFASGAALQLLAKRKDCRVGKFTMQDIEKTLKKLLLRFGLGKLRLGLGLSPLAYGHGQIPTSCILVFLLSFLVQCLC